jgi:hypothetical protein
MPEYRAGPEWGRIEATSNSSRCAKAIHRGAPQSLVRETSSKTMDPIQPEEWGAVTIRQLLRMRRLDYNPFRPVILRPRIFESANWQAKKEINRLRNALLQSVEAGAMGVVCGVY